MKEIWAEIKTFKTALMRLYCKSSRKTKQNKFCLLQERAQQAACASLRETRVYHIKPCLCGIGCTQKSISPPGICIPLILANIDWASVILIYFNRSNVTLDPNEAHYSVGKNGKWECVCKSVNTQADKRAHTHTM